MKMPLKITRRSCKQFYNTTTFKWLAFILMLLLNTTSIIIDWIFLAKLNSLETGLVYPAVSTDIVWAVMEFAFIGSSILPLEIFNMWLKLYQGRGIMSPDLFSAAAVWFADIPQIILHIVVVDCRTGPVSILQFAKGVVVLTSACIRFPIALIRSCIRKQQLKYRVLIFIGVILSFTGSVLVIFFTFSQVKDGRLTGSDQGKYFQNVAIFLDQRFICRSTKPAWLKMTDIQILEDTDKDIVFRYSIQERNNKALVTFTSNIGSSAMMDRKRFSFEIADEFTEGNSSEVTSTPLEKKDDSYKILFQFHYSRPKFGFLSNSKLYGDIYYNVRKIHADGRTFGGSGAITRGINNPLRYFGYHPYNDSQLIFGPDNLTDVSELWRTGFFDCASRGRQAPSEQRNIAINDTYFYV